ncbi:glycosyltransferase family 4 protein [Planctomycetota bacterium]|nr:glycosyltransferase family 4 protein [Planctomycetota bacterium]
MDTLNFLSLNLLPFLLAMGGSYWLSRPGNKLAAIDKPNNRSMHSVPTPRGGGLAVLAPLLLMYAISLGDFMDGNIVIGLLLVAIVSYIDDRRSLSSRLRLVVHAIAACVLVLPQGHPLYIGIGLCLLTVWCINLYNFMDGIDGLAASMGAIGFLAIYIVNLHNVQAQLASISSIVAFSCLGFLVFNFPPAKIFLGDVGSASLGYLMAVAIVLTTEGGLSGSWVPLLIFAPFLFDSTFTIARRLLSGEKFWTAHRSHLYQRLALRVGARRALLAFATIMILCSWIAWRIV